MSCPVSRMHSTLQCIFTYKDYWKYKVWHYPAKMLPTSAINHSGELNPRIQHGITPAPTMNKGNKTNSTQLAIFNQRIFGAHFYFIYKFPPTKIASSKIPSQCSPKPHSPPPQKKLHKITRILNLWKVFNILVLHDNIHYQHTYKQRISLPYVIIQITHLIGVILWQRNDKACKSLKYTFQNPPWPMTAILELQLAPDRQGFMLTPPPW